MLTLIAHCIIGILPSYYTEEEDDEDFYCNRNELVFNSGLGYGRTTLAMVIAVLIYNAYRRRLHSLSKKQSHNETSDATSTKGNFKVIQGLLRMLPNGLQSKMQVDMAIDTCSQFENLRDSIMENKIKSTTAEGKQQEQDLQRAVYLPIYVV